jgi:hypothetical protein
MNWKRNKGEKLSANLTLLFRCIRSYDKPEKRQVAHNVSVDHRTLQTGRERSAGVKHAYL